MYRLTRWATTNSLLPFLVLTMSTVVQTGVSPGGLQAQSGYVPQFAHFATSRLDAAPQGPDVGVSTALPIPSIRTSASGAGLVIHATFNANVDAATQTIINNAIASYESTFTNPITVNIEFYEMSSGLGTSTSPTYTVPYSTYRTALMNNSASADDATALATLPDDSGNPVNGGSIEVTSANGRAIGLDTPEFTFGSPCQNFTGSGCIGLNVTLANGHGALLSVVEHEMDEVLGLGSALPSFATPSPEDLFRWASAGTRSFATNPSMAVPCVAPSAFFSIDGGNTNLNAFNNCDNGGDYGDWITHTPSQVQDAFTNFSGTPFLSVTSTEIRALDVIGYTIVSQKKRKTQITSN
jgi:hypothetical protein